MIIIAKSRRPSSFSVSITGIIRRSCWLINSGSLSASEMAIRLPALAVTNDPTIQVTNINMIVPFKTFSSIKPKLKPMRITAIVAAACDVLNPNIRFRCVLLYPNIFCVIKAASHLVARAIAVNAPAIINAPDPFNNTRKSTSIPTLIKKKGIKIALPVNSIRFINGEVCGISWFNARPARNAPIIASIPASSANQEARNTIASTKIK